MAVTEDAPPPLLERLWAYADPGILILVAIKEFFLTILRAIFINRSPSLPLSPTRLRDLAFAEFWQSMAPPLHLSTSGSPPPALEGSLGALAPYLPEIEGVVLDLGPGTGHLCYYFPSASGQIQAVYGAEPNVGLHAELRRNADGSGLGSKYAIMSCGAEAGSLMPRLKAEGLVREGRETEGVFNTIVAVRVLCGIPELEKNLEVLYGLLKPGGKFVLVEHVVNPVGKGKGRGGVIGRLTQILYKPLWEFFIRCHMDADTETLLMRVGERNGGWEKVNVFRRLEWSPMAWWGGVLVKKRS